jgi:hypothetical protein
LKSWASYSTPRESMLGNFGLPRSDTIARLVRKRT